jgi:hypothetical protein
MFHVDIAYVGDLKSRKLTRSLCGASGAVSGVVEHLAVLTSGQRIANWRQRRGIGAARRCNA